MIRKKFNSEFPKAFLKFTMKVIFVLIQNKLFLYWYRKDLPEEKKILENTRKHDFFQDIIANNILEILTFLKSAKFLNSFFKSSKSIDIKQYAHFC